jgi:hypothetical protein
MITIKTPVAGYNGIDCGVKFENGVGVVDTLAEHVINWFKDQGYIVEIDKSLEEKKSNSEDLEIQQELNDGSPEPTPVVSQDNTSDKTIDDLKKEAKALGIESIRNKATKAEIIKLINDKKLELEALTPPEAQEGGSPEPTPVVNAENTKEEE